LLRNIQKLDHVVTVTYGNNTITRSDIRGEVELFPAEPGINLPAVNLVEVLYTPKAPHNMLSVTKGMERGMGFTFKDNICTIVLPDDSFHMAKKKKGVFYIKSGHVRHQETAQLAVIKEKRTKLDDQSQVGRLVGYAAHTKGYVVLLNDNSTVVTRDVVIDESGTLQSPAGTTSAFRFRSAEEDQESCRHIPVPTPIPVLTPPVPAPATSEMQPDIPAWTEQQAPMQTHIEQQPTETEPETTTTATPTPSAPVTLRRSTRERQPPSYLDGFDTTQKRSYTRRDNTDSDSHETASMALIDAPATYEEAMSSEYAENWKQAMQEEMQSLIANNTWELKTAPSGTNIIPTKWVYAIKRDANGDITRFKARLVAKGFKQKEGIDFDEVFAPVSKHSTLRALLAKVSADNLELRQLDVTTAFLQGDINEEVFVQQPQGFKQGKGLTCHLNRALYGLRQAPRAWYQRLHSELDSIGFKESSADPSLYIKIYKTHIVYVLVYVDDILIAGNKEAVDYVSACLSSAFKVRDLGDVHLFLGMTITRDRKNRMLMLGQERMTTSLLTKYGQESARPNATPLNSSITLCRTEGEPLDTDKYPYSNVIGSLMYLSVCTRPDISQAVGALARYMTAPTTVHWKAAISVLRSLAGTSDYGIMFAHCLLHSHLL